MSRVAERSRVALFLADYANADASHKVNALGAGWGVAGTDVTRGVVAPQTVIVFIDSPPELYGDEFVFSLTLRDSTGTAVVVPGPTGNPEPLRVAQNLRVEEPATNPQLHIPRGTVWAHNQIVLNLAEGLRLPLGDLYTWTLDLDGTRSDRWGVSFYVPAAHHGPVFGGPDNPASIPGIDPRG